jgi:uncharacterized coiled-coil protein SlyX
VDPILQVIISTGTVIAAAIVAIVVGSRKGLADVEARTDAEMARLVAALEGRIKVLEADLATANQQIGQLTAKITEQGVEITQLQSDLKDERRITARLNGGSK